MQVEIITPLGSVCQQEASEVIVPATDGQVGILENHAPMLAALGEGEVTLKGVNAPVTFEVSGGFFQIEKKYVYILAEKATPIT